MFEINDAMVENRKEIDAVHGKFYCLMDILFSKMSTIFFFSMISKVISSVKCNAMTSMRSIKQHSLPFLFSFTLQTTLTAYVVLH